MSLPEGSTANDARLEDIKVGADGVIYDSPGTAVRSQATNGFNVVDGSQIGFPKEKGAFANLMCSDGVHPSELGHQFYARGLSGVLN